MSDSDSDRVTSRKRGRASGGPSLKSKDLGQNIQTRLFIDGRFVDSQSGKTFPTYNPATGELLIRVAEADKADVDIAVKAARHAFENTWKYTNGSARRDLLLKLADLVDTNKEELATLESLDKDRKSVV